LLNEPLRQPVAYPAMPVGDTGDRLVRRRQLLRGFTHAAATLHIRGPVVPWVHFVTRIAFWIEYALRVPRLQPVEENVCEESHPMNTFTDNITRRRIDLGLEVRDVWVALTTRGIDVAYTTVAGWFNGSRGVRWKVNELQGLMDVLGTSLREMQGSSVILEDPLEVALGDALHRLSSDQKAAVLAIAKTMQLPMLPPPKPES
jgi:hypothetical protein